MAKWQKLMLISAGSSALLIYEITTATEAPIQALALVQYALLAGALMGLVGALVMYVQQE